MSSRKLVSFQQLNEDNEKKPTLIKLIWIVWIGLCVCDARKISIWLENWNRGRDVECEWHMVHRWEYVRMKLSPLEAILCLENCVQIAFGFHSFKHNKNWLRFPSETCVLENCILNTMEQWFGCDYIAFNYYSWLHLHSGYRVDRPPAGHIMRLCYYWRLTSNEACEMIFQLIYLLRRWIDLSFGFCFNLRRTVSRPWQGCSCACYA